MNYRELSLLFNKLVNNECTDEEADLIMNLFSDRSYDDLFRQLAEEQLKQSPSDEDRQDVSKSALDLQLRAILKANVKKKAVTEKTWKISILYVAAASLLFLVIVTYFYHNIKPKAFVADAGKQQISAGGNKAILTLGNGTKINLEAVVVGAIAAQSNFTIKKTSNGVLVYQANATSKVNSRETDEHTYNTISTPEGGQYQVVLPDGSKVWLNAASSIKFPTQFSRLERVVELSGEAYFEVVKISSPQTNKRGFKSQPFIVLSRRQKIEVLGTKFNVNDYAEENCVKTTLLKGSVKVIPISGDNQKASAISQILRPGEQSKLNGDNLNISEADTAAATAWKDGFFQFDNEDVYVVMRKIARWYNVEVEYHGDMRGKVFSGVISKYDDIRDVLKMLQLTGSVSFAIKDHKIIVS
ncbi:DUF4974 domain-containing protein [Mucilaginibacter sp. BJC16-A38]|uniref:FecR family protein n=1 Tax=Mucilaginibacter phenanthrenivorans TaxID=1234842 RepID=UPI0021580F0B|nr:FecR domain-containing protein [Mucilaginibacter phenanthrenivorans]MCR8560137.1 DUF4974 domain-containing protein [Mucilaginibacter phenanthrenivorans]